MASAALAAPSAPKTAELKLYRFSVAQYQEMFAKGILTTRDRVELIEGYLTEKPKINPPHAQSVRRTSIALARHLPAGWITQVQLPITLSESEPQPDFSIVRGGEDQYSDRHPGPADTALVIEVSDSTLADDRGIMRQLYARDKIPTYWIVNIPDNQLEVYTK